MVVWSIVDLCGYVDCIESRPVEWLCGSIVRLCGLRGTLSGSVGLALYRMVLLVAWDIARLSHRVGCVLSSQCVVVWVVCGIVRLCVLCGTLLGCVGRVGVSSGSVGRARH